MWVRRLGGRRNRYTADAHCERLGVGVIQDATGRPFAFELDGRPAPGVEPSDVDHARHDFAELDAVHHQDRHHHRADQDTKLVIQLPPGSAQDQTTCTSNVINVRTALVSSPQIDVAPSFNYRVTGLPSFITVTQAPSPASPLQLPTLSFTFNIAGVRTLTATSNSTIKITNPIDTLRSTSLVLQVVPIQARALLRPRPRTQPARTPAIRSTSR